MFSLEFAKRIFASVPYLSLFNHKKNLIANVDALFLASVWSSLRKPNASQYYESECDLLSSVLCEFLKTCTFAEFTSDLQKNGTYGKTDCFSMYPHLPLISPLFISHSTNFESFSRRIFGQFFLKNF